MFDALPLPEPQPKIADALPLIADSFAGGGGASTGIEMALGRSPDVAINHDPVALSMHEANHPDTLHLTNSVYAVDPASLLKPGQRVGLAWFSPDCKHHSKAKGGKPLDANIRDLAWVVVHWAERVRPDVIFLENVEEFADWCPLTPEGKPNPEMKGDTFRLWVGRLKKLGYRVEWRLLKACDYGAPTIRKRLYLVARCDGRPIVWPEPTHGPDRPRPWIAAHEIIDWSLPCPSIFDTSEEIMAKHGLRAVRPLADNTLRRVAKGVAKYVIEAEDPFFVTYAQHGGAVRSGFDPVHTITASLKDQNQVVVPSMVQIGYGEAKGPVSTITARGTQQNIVAAHMVNMHGSGRSARDMRDPVTSICAGGNHAGLVAAFMTKYYGQGVGQTVRDPLHTIGTKDTFGVVTVNIHGQTYAITDIGMRMLTPREQFRAQGFPETYIIDRGADGKPMPKTHQTQKCGNSVCPPVAAALVRANCPHLVVDNG